MTVVEVFGVDCYRLDQLTLGPAPIVLDLGANIGAFALRVLSTHPGAVGTCVEPSPRTCIALSQNLKLNGAADRFEIVAAAVTGSHAPASARLFEQPGDSWTNSIVPACIEASHERGTWIDVPTVSLEGLLGKWPEGVDVLKIDVEGAEYDILTGTSQEMLKGVRQIVIEYHAVSGRRLEELVERLREAGFDWLGWEQWPIPRRGMAWWQRRDA